MMFDTSKVQEFHEAFRNVFDRYVIPKNGDAIPVNMSHMGVLQGVILDPPSEKSPTVLKPVVLHMCMTVPTH